MTRSLLILASVGLLGTGAGSAQEQDHDLAMQHSVEQLRAVVGRWEVVTEFLMQDGSIAKSVRGTYSFEWVVPDRVVAGRSEIPELQQAAGILFYINTAERLIEMVSVGSDGHLWIMTGALGGEERLSQPYKAADGLTRQLRFTRFNASQESFESRMEYTDDGGNSWKPGNHQTFVRAAPEAG